MSESPKKLSEKIAELDKSTEWFYSDEFNLDEAVAKYKEAIELAKDLQKDLAELTNEIEVLSEDFSK
ncbi:exodeoxyribonuclease VII small subunit [Candidatus Saccharibacteria bacterium]|nr:exodeoxyribonuclease VII small subunit [Candidatus Saccharibacteria bacterium]